MKESKHSITFKVIIGYLLLTAFAGATVWFVYTKIMELNKPAKIETGRKKMALISEVATRLYTAEGISRNIVQNESQDTVDIRRYRNSIDTISTLIDSLQILYTAEVTRSELDTVQTLLSLKESNLQELLELRRNNSSDNYYDRVLKWLEEADYIFGSTDYKSMVKDLKPYQQKVIIDYLKYAEKDNADRLTQRTADSIVQTVKTVLLKLEMKEHRYQMNIEDKEDKLLANDLKISRRLRALRTKIEQEEIQKSIERVKTTRETLNETSRIMILFGASCVVTILIFVIMIIRDTNRSQRYRVELEGAKGYAESLLKSREQIMATVTHDLRSPLNSILGYADLMNKTELTLKQKSYLTQLRKSSDYTMRLVNDLLDFSRLEAGKILIEGLPFVPRKVIEDVVQGSVPSPDPKALNLNYDLSEDLQKTFISDPFRLHQILANLIGNAYKFTEKGDLLISGKIEAKAEEKWLVLAIKDTGIGISKKQQKAIFQEFSQAESSTGKGFGLGLAISQKLAALLDGKITVKSMPQQGSVFTLKIPIKLSATPLEETEAEKQNIALSGADQKHILVVDDDEVQLSLATEILSHQGFVISTARDGEAALTKINAVDFDAVLTDVQMPRLDGFELIKALRADKKTRNMPVIALSGEGDKSKLDYLETGFTEYLLKPYEMNELLRLLAEMLKLKVEVSQVAPAITNSDSHQLYDLHDLKQFTVGDQESLKAILASLIENTHDNIAALQEAKQANDAEKIAFVAHKMLPMLRQIKAEQIVEPLEKLERQKEHNVTQSQLKTLVNDVAKHTEALLEALNRELS